MFKFIPDNVDVFLVGGGVRDQLMNVAPNDLDFVVVGLDSFDQLPALLVQLGCSPLPQKSGSSFVLNADAKTAKAKHDLGVLDFKVVDSLDADLASRDFTVNAMALNCKTQQLVDPLFGQADLNDKVLRPCHMDCFLQSPERVFRAVRFQAKGFSLSPVLHQLADDPDLLSVVQSANRDRLAQQADRMFKRGNVVHVFQFFAQHDRLASALLQDKLQLRSLVQ